MGHFGYKIFSRIFYDKLLMKYSRCSRLLKHPVYMYIKKMEVLHVYFTLQPKPPTADHRCLRVSSLKGGGVHYGGCMSGVVIVWEIWGLKAADIRGFVVSELI